MKKLAELEKKSDPLLLQDELMASVACGIFAYALDDKRILSVNPEAKKLFGFGDEPSYADFREFIDNNVFPDSREDLRGAVESLKAVGDSCDIAFKAGTPEDTIYINSKISRIKLSDSTECILFTLYDTTSYHRYLNTLERDRVNYCQALTNGCEFSFSFDLTAGIIKQDFPMAHKVSLLKILSLDPPVRYDEMNEKYVDIFKIRFLKPEMAKYFTCAGLLEAYENGENNVIIEYLCSKTNIYISTKVTMYLECETNHTFAFVAATNTTEERLKALKHERALQEASDMLERSRSDMDRCIDYVLDGISDGFRIIDVTTNGYTYVSENAARLQGYSADEFMEKFGSHITKNMFPPDSQKAFSEAFSQVSEKDSFQVKYRIEDKDGNIKWVLDSGKPIVNSQGKRICFSVLHDITDLEERNERLNFTLAMQEHICDSIATGIFAYTMPQRKILLLNQAIKDMYGYDGVNSEQLGHHLMDLVDPKDKPLVVKAVKSLKKPGDSTEYIFHSTRANGSGITLKNTTKLLNFANGQYYILTSMTDITEQEKKSALAVEESSKLNEAALGDGEIFFTVDLDDGLCSDPIISENGRKLLEYFGAEIPMRYDDLARICIGTGKAIPLSGNTESLLNCEKLKNKHKSGVSRITAEFRIPDMSKYFRVTFMLSRISGGSVHASIIIYDITSEKKIKKPSRAVIESLGQIYSSIYYISLRDKQYISLRQYDDMADRRPESGSLSTLINTFLGEFVLPTHREEMTAFFDTNTIYDRLAHTDLLEIEYKRRDIGWCRGIIAAAERDPSGRVTSVVYAARCIESQKQEEITRINALRTAYEAEKNSNDAKTAFLENMSRDIRTPMNSIIGMAAIAETHIDEKERVADCLDKINVASKQLLEVINEILDMSKIELGKMELHDEFFNITEFVDNLVTVNQHRINEKKHKLTVKINDLEHENVIGDNLRLNQIFSHLISNSVKYTPVGGKISLTVSEKPSNRATAACYEFVFKDNGIGIDEEFIKRIFEPFSRATNDKRLAQIAGSGLGMAITRNIVQMMNGDIHIDSQINKGTTVTVTIMLKTETESFSSYDDRFKGLRVLVADDDEDTCRTTCETLSELGMICEWVTDGGAAINQVLERHSVGDDYLAVILDRKLSGINGIAAAKEIIERIGGKAPSIIMSAFDRSDIETEARAAGVSAFISKPVFKSRLIHLFNELIGYGTDSRKPKSSIEDIKAENFSGRRTLLVEDDELNAEIAGEIISLAGLKVDYASNGKEALEMIESAEDDYYDIVFMDIQMPVMNGYEAVKAIRSLPGGYPKRVPIIAMTASVFAEDIAAAKSAGMNEHIAKPIDFDQLLLVLKTWLDTN